MKKKLEWPVAVAEEPMARGDEQTGRYETGARSPGGVHDRHYPVKATVKATTNLFRLPVKRRSNHKSTIIITRRFRPPAGPVSQG